MGQELPIKEVCEQLGLKRRTLERWIKRGCPTIKRGKYRYFDMEALNAWRTANGMTGRVGAPSDLDRVEMQERAGLPPVPEAASPVGGLSKLKKDLLKAKLAKTAADAKRSMLRYEQDREAFLPKDEVERMFVERIETCKRGLLSLANRCAARCEGCTAEEIEHLIREEVFSLLEDFSRR